VEGYNEKILVVDGEESTRQVLNTRLTLLGYNVLLVRNGNDALVIFNKEQPDLVILDIVLSKLDGYEVCRKIRKISETPIIMLTALGGISDRIMGLELGADDYVIKPFYPKELEARIRCILRRSGNSIQTQPNKNKNVLNIGNLMININTQQVSKDGSKIRLTGMEFSLLELLIANSGKPLSRKIILNNVWGYTPERYVDTRVVDVHISRLRSKLEEDPTNPDLILTARGTGYTFQQYL